MGITPDRTPGPSLEEEIQLEDRTADGNPTTNGAIRYLSGDIVAKLPSGVISLTSGTGLSEGAHDSLRQLIHFIDDGPGSGFLSGAYKEILPTSAFPTSQVWWESSSKLKKIVSLDITWTGVLPTQEVWKVYDTDGSAVLATITDTITYSSVFEASRTRAIA